MKYYIKKGGQYIDPNDSQVVEILEENVIFRDDGSTPNTNPITRNHMIVYRDVNSKKVFCEPKDRFTSIYKPMCEI